MRPRPILSERCRLLPLFAHFHANIVFHFNFLNRLAPSVSMMRTLAPSNAFQADAIRFEEAKATQSDGGGSFTLSLCVSVNVSLMVM
jgi:hypothetical protein